MKKLFLILAFVLISSSFANASGIVHMRSGDTLELNAESINHVKSYSWVVKKENEILIKNEGKNFKYDFLENGSYEVSLLVNMNNGSRKSTVVNVLVSDGKIITEDNQVKKLSAIIEALPQKTEEDSMAVPKGTEVFIIASSSMGDIKEYHIDTDLSKDSDGDGDARNDIDNKDSQSFFSGEVFSLGKIDSKREISLTVIDKDERKDSTKFTINIGEDAPTGFKAVLSTFPPSDEDGIIHLKGDEADLIFFAGGSNGEIVEYRIDKNVNFDTDQDEDPKNDVDNILDDSLHTGEMWTTDYAKEWGEIVVQLTVVSAEGKGSRVQRKIIFDKTEDEFITLTPSVKKGGKLMSDKDEISQGESLILTLIPSPSEDAVLKWDFDGDGNVELENNVNSVAFLYEIAGNFTVNLTVVEGKEESVYTKEIVVNEVEQDGTETSQPNVNFEYSTEGDIVRFDNLSSADENLENTNLSYLWDFGDGNLSEEESPTHKYDQYGSFMVVLTATDASENTSKKIEEIQIEYQEGMALGGVDLSGNIDIENADGTPDSSQENSEGSKAWFYILLFFLVLILIPLVYLLFEKIRHPSLTFLEIIEGVKERVQGGGFKQDIPMEVSEETPEEPLEVAEVVEEKPEEETKEETQDPEEEKSVPDWLKENSENPEETKEVEDYGETENASEEENNVPDWLKENSETSEEVKDLEETKTSEEVKETEEIKTPKETPEEPLEVAEVVEEKDVEVSSEEDSTNIENVEVSEEASETENVPDFLQENSEEKTEKPEDASDWLKENLKEEDLQVEAENELEDISEAEEVVEADAESESEVEEIRKEAEEKVEAEERERAEKEEEEKKLRAEKVVQETRYKEAENELEDISEEIENEEDLIEAESEAQEIEEDLEFEAEEIRYEKSETELEDISEAEEVVEADAESESEVEEIRKEAEEKVEAERKKAEAEEKERIKKEEEEKKIEEEQKKLEGIKRLEEEREAEEGRKKAQEEKEKAEAELKRAEEEKEAKEEQKKLEERQKKEEEKKRIKTEERRKEEEERRKVEEDLKRFEEKEEIEAEKIKEISKKNDSKEIDKKDEAEKFLRHEDDNRELKIALEEMKKKKILEENSPVNKEKPPNDILVSNNILLDANLLEDDFEAEETKGGLLDDDVELEGEIHFAEEDAGEIVLPENKKVNLNEESVSEDMNIGNEALREEEKEEEEKEEKWIEIEAEEEDKKNNEF